MTYKSIMVAVDLRPHSEQCITFAASLADRFGARLIGAAAEVEFVPVYPEAPVADALLIDTERKRVAGDVEKAKSLFRRIAGSRAAVQWRCGAQEPTKFLLENARAADPGTKQALAQLGRRIGSASGERDCRPRQGRAPGRNSRSAQRCDAE